MDLVLGIDLGTSYFKLGLFDRTGRLCGLGRVAVPTHKNEDRCELSVADFQQTLWQGLSQACQQANAKPEHIKAVSYASQANTFLLLDQNLLPLTPLIVWTDRRAQPPAETVSRLFARDDFTTITGLGVFGPEFLPAKLVWFRENHPQIYGRIASVMTISDYLVYLLTGRRAGDAGTAALLGLWDLKNARWWDKAFNALNIPTAWFSTMLQPGSLAGRTLPHAWQWLGVLEGIPVAAGGLDHHIAGIGAGLGLLADMSLSLGTVIACLHIREGFSGLSHCCAGPDIIKGRFFQLAFDANGAATLETYRDRNAPDSTIPQLLQAAENVPPGCEGLHYSQHNGFVQERKINYTSGHYARAILESTAATARSLIEKVLKTEIPKRLLVTGGGARSSLWLRIIAEVLGSEVIACDCEEPACRGAAMSAGQAAGWFNPLAESREKWCTADRCYSPDPAARTFYRQWYEKQLRYGVNYTDAF